MAGNKTVDVAPGPLSDVIARLDEAHPGFKDRLLDDDGVTGAFDQLDIVTLAAGAVYRVPDAPEDENYLVAHSSTFTVIDPEGRVHAIFTSPFDPDAIAGVLRELTDS
mgnify:CR=1 FL=1